MPCATCGTVVYREPAKLRRHAQHFCSPACHARGQKANESNATTFWLRVARSAGPSGCWLWMGGRDSWGYGSVRWKGAHVGVHRVAWELTNGAAPPGLHVLHACDVRACCNPKHLMLGTNAANIADKVAKARQARGERNGNAKLTVSIVREIRRQHALGVPCATIAQRLGAKRTTVRDVAQRRRWNHVA